jgi:uncharacterized membrane protein YphA (DoxX/SURF4 family)
MTELDKHSDYAALVGRLFLASMFLLFGYGKLTGYSGAVSYMGSLGLPAPALFTVLRSGFGIYRPHAVWRSESIPAFHEEYGDRRWFAGVFCFR